MHIDLRIFKPEGKTRLLAMIVGHGLHGTTITAGYHTGTKFTKQRLFDLKIGPTFIGSLEVGNKMLVALKSAETKAGTEYQFVYAGQTVKIERFAEHSAFNYAVFTFHLTGDHQLVISLNEMTNLIALLEGALDPSTDIQ